jgi:uncharacterized protein (DUF362 family)
MGTSNRKGQYTRREFLQLLSALGGAATLSALLQACSQAGIDPASILIPETPQPEPTPTDRHEPTPIPDQVEAESEEPSPSPTKSPQEEISQDSSIVAFIKTSNRAQGVRRAMDMFDLSNISGKSVFLKPNFNSPDPTPGSTHPDVLRSIVLTLQSKGVNHITVGDRSGMGDTRYSMEELGIFKLAGELDFDTVVFDEMPADHWVMFQPENSHWKLGFPFAKPCLEADLLIQTCCLKTHRHGGHFTMSLKNTVGMVAKDNLVDNHDFMHELHSSPHQRRMIAEINTAYSPHLVILDGVEAFIDGGPARGKKAFSEVILASKDRVAIDAVGVALLRYHGCQTEVSKGKVFQQDQLQRAVKLGLGVDSPEKIAFLTADPESAAYAGEIKKVLLS